MERGLPLVFSLFIFMFGCVSSYRYNFKNKHVALFVFGDSLFDPGNNNYINTTKRYRANFWPYGESYFNPPSGRFSNGRLIPDFIAEYAGLPLTRAYLDPSYKKNDFVYGANFASGGAGALVETNAEFVISLKTQLKYFGDLEKHFRKNLGDAKTDQLLADAVYLFSCGSTDYASLPTQMFEQYLKNVIGNLTDVFKGIHEKGGRKFAILNLPQSVGCFPISRVQQPGYTCNEELNKLVTLHNDQIPKKLEDLQTQLDGFIYAIFDYSTAVNNRMNNPSQYGFKVGDTACCGSGPFRGIYDCGREKGFELCNNVDDYFFFEATHPNEVAYRQLAELFWNGDSNVTTSYNLKTLFQGRNFGLLSSE